MAAGAAVTRAFGHALEDAAVRLGAAARDRAIQRLSDAYADVLPGVRVTPLADGLRLSARRLFARFAASAAARHIKGIVR